MDIKASEIAGELKRAQRMYDIFAQASKMVDVLAGYERREAEAKATISALEAEAKRLNKSIEDTIAEANKKLDGAKERAAKADKEAAALKAEASSILAKAKEEAAKLLKQAQDNASMAATSLKQVKGQIEEAKVVLSELKSAQQMLIDEMHAKRDALLKAFS